MRESRTYGSVRGRSAMSVLTAILSPNPYPSPLMEMDLSKHGFGHSE